jgi:hypothetical protein
MFDFLQHFYLEISGENRLEFSPFPSALLFLVTAQDKPTPSLISSPLTPKVRTRRWTISGTHQDDFQGVPPTGRPITMKGIEFSRVVDGKIAEHWVQFDVLAVIQQIGAFPGANS